MRPAAHLLRLTTLAVLIVPVLEVAAIAAQKLPSTGRYGRR